MEKIILFFKRIERALESQNIKRFFLKPQQLIALDRLLDGQDVMAILPTGFGKSLIYQLLPNLIPEKRSTATGTNSNNIVIVVSPLNSIIEDQSKVLEYRGISVGVLSTMVERKMTKAEDLFVKSNGSDGEKCSTISDKIKNGRSEVLFSHPESLLSPEGRALLKSDIFQSKVVACVIDEAHCMELWGEKFRTDYRDLVVLKSLFPSAVTLILTATAPSRMINNIKSTLCLHEQLVIVKASPNRSNLFLEVKKKLPNNYGILSYDRILKPLAEKLNKEKTAFPMTIVYTKLNLLRANIKCHIVFQ